MTDILILMKSNIKTNTRSHLNLLMSDIDISSLPISKIRTALKDLGLSGSGTKKELIERYNDYQANQNNPNEQSNDVASIPEVTETAPASADKIKVPQQEEPTVVATGIAFY